MKNKIKLNTALTVSVLALAIAEPAFAAGADGWEQPAVKLIEVLESGLVKIATVVIGVAILGYAIYQAFQNDFQIKPLAVKVFAGILIMAGPTMIKTLLGSLG